VDEVGGGGVFADDGVGDGAEEDAAVEEGGGFGEVFGELDAADGGIDGVVVRAGDLFAVAAAFGVEGVDLGGAAAEPEEDAGVGFAFGQGGRGGHLGEFATGELH